MGNHPNLNQNSAVDPTLGGASALRASTFYFPTLDGLRFFAFIFVFIHHLPKSDLFVLEEIHAHGWVGVHLFLALSAYLLTSILKSEYETTGRLSLFKFYVRRSLRIWPLYFAFCGLIAVYVFFRTGWTLKTGVRLLGLVTFSDNIITSFRGFSRIPFSAHLWTISLEEQFYLLLPFVLRRWFSSMRRLLVGLLVMWGAFLLARLGAVVSGATHPFIWTSVFSADALLFGTALGAVRWKQGSGSVARMATVGLGLALLFSAAWAPFIGTVGPHQVWLYTSVGLGAVLLVVAAVSDPTLGWLGAQPLRYLGKISYGLYVFHLLGIEVGVRVANLLSGGSWWLVAGSSLCVTVVLSASSYELFEKRFLRIKQRFELVHSRPA